MQIAVNFLMEKAAPFRESSSDGSHQHGLDGVHPVLRLVEYHAVAAAEHLVGDLPDVHALVLPLLGQLSLKSWKEGRQCMKMTLGLPVCSTILSSIR